MKENLSDQDLDKLRQSADPLADECVSGLVAANQLSQVNILLEHLTGAGVERPILPAALEHYLVESARLPSDFDEARFTRAQRAFALHGPTLGIALMYASLPALYAGAQGGVQLLSMTGQLRKHYRRRAAVSLRFILDCMEPGSFQGNGAGLFAVQRVRLIHATVRHFAKTSGRWAALPEWGEPLNQEELLGTLLAFSVQAIDGSAQLGGPLSAQEAEDLLYAWQVVGELLGIQRAAFPRNVPEARQLRSRIASRNFAPTPEGQRLAQDHIDFLDELVPSKAFGSINLALSHWLMGNYVSETCLQLKRPAHWTFALLILRPLVRIADTLLERRSPLRQLAEHVHVELMDELNRWWSNGQSPQFRLPIRIGPDGTSSHVAQVKDNAPVSESQA